MEKHDIKVMKLLTELTKEMEGFVQLEEPTSSNAEMKYSLAQMYSQKGFRDYLQRAIAQKKAEMGDCVDLKGLWTLKGRVEILVELMRVSKQMFEESQKLDKNIG